MYPYNHLHKGDGDGYNRRHGQEEVQFPEIIEQPITVRFNSHFYWTLRMKDHPRMQMLVEPLDGYEHFSDYLPCMSLNMDLTIEDAPPDIPRMWRRVRKSALALMKLTPVTSFAQSISELYYHKLLCGNLLATCTVNEPVGNAFYLVPMQPGDFLPHAKTYSKDYAHEYMAEEAEFIGVLCRPNCSLGISTAATQTSPPSADDDEEI